MVIRWGTTVVSLLLALSDVRDGDERLVVSCALLLAYSVFRTIRPLRYRDDLPSLLAVLGEVVFTVLLVVATGYWESPLAFSLLTAVAVAGFAPRVRVRPAHRDGVARGRHAALGPPT